MNALTSTVELVTHSKFLQQINLSFLLLAVRMRFASISTPHVLLYCYYFCEQELLNKLEAETVHSVSYTARMH